MQRGRGCQPATATCKLATWPLAVRIFHSSVMWFALPPWGRCQHHYWKLPVDSRTGWRLRKVAPGAPLLAPPLACLGPPRARAPVHNLLRAQRRPVRTSLARQLHPACGARALGSRARRSTRRVFMGALAISPPLQWGRAPQFQARTRAREPPVGWSQCMAQSALSPWVWPGPRTRRAAAGHV